MPILPQFAGISDIHFSCFFLCLFLSFTFILIFFFFFVDEFDSLASNNRLLKISPLLSLSASIGNFTYSSRSRLAKWWCTTPNDLIDAIFNFCTVNKMHSQKNITLNAFSACSIYSSFYVVSSSRWESDSFILTVLIIFCRNVLKTATNCTFLDVNKFFFFFFSIFTNTQTSCSLATRVW